MLILGEKSINVPARTSGTWATTDNAKLLGIRFVMGRTGSSYSGAVVHGQMIVGMQN